MDKRILFYSSVSDLSLFKTQKFYQIDIEILSELGYKITLSNKIADSLKFWKYDILFGYFFKYSFFAGFIARIFGKSVYFTGGIDALDKDFASKKSHFLQKIFFLLCYWVSNKCIIVSKTDYRNIIRIAPQKKWRKLVISEHSINTSRFTCDDSAKKNYFTTVGWLGNVGNVKRKGIDTAIKIFAELKKHSDFADFKLIIIGKCGAGLKYLEEIINNLGVGKDVTITGEVSEDEKIELLKKSMYYFQPSLYEGFGIAALEAWCANNIIIKSNKGGLSNPIYNDRSYLFNTDKPFEEAMQELISQIESKSEFQAIDNNLILKYDNQRRKADFSNILNQ